MVDGNKILNDSVFITQVINRIVGSNRQYRDVRVDAYTSRPPVNIYPIEEVVSTLAAIERNRLITQINSGRLVGEVLGNFTCYVMYASKCPFGIYELEQLLTRSASSSIERNSTNLVVESNKTRSRRSAFFSSHITHTLLPRKLLSYILKSNHEIANQTSTYVREKRSHIVPGALLLMNSILQSQLPTPERQEEIALKNIQEVFKRKEIEIANLEDGNTKLHEIMRNMTSLVKDVVKLTTRPKRGVGPMIALLGLSAMEETQEKPPKLNVEGLETLSQMYKNKVAMISQLTSENAKLNMLIQKMSNLVKNALPLNSTIVPSV